MNRFDEMDDKLLEVMADQGMHGPTGNGAVVAAINHLKKTILHLDTTAAKQNKWMIGLTAVGAAPTGMGAVRTWVVAHR